MKLRTIVLTITVLTAAGMWAPQVLAEAYAAADTSARQESKWTKAFSRLTVGGYGEAVGTYNFYSDNVFRYQFPDSYRDSKGHARFDLPHVVIMLGYDFGKGWTLGTEIEFEHGGVEAAVEMENEEAGEFEREIERGGEVALEQFWIQKEFMPELNLRMGHIVVPVGATNNKHLPTEFSQLIVPRARTPSFLAPGTKPVSACGAAQGTGGMRFSCCRDLTQCSSVIQNGSTEARPHPTSSSPQIILPERSEWTITR